MKEKKERKKERTSAQCKAIQDSLGSRGVLDQYLGRGEPLRVWNPDPVYDKKIPRIHTLFRAKPSILLPCLGQTSAKLYTLLRTERTKTIPCPETHPRIGHIRSTPRVLDSRFHAVHFWSLSEELRFWIPRAVFWTPKHRIPYPTNFPEIRNPNSLTRG